jgi:hypothetical protein
MERNTYEVLLRSENLRCEIAEQVQYVVATSLPEAAQLAEAKKGNATVAFVRLLGPCLAIQSILEEE